MEEVIIMNMNREALVTSVSEKSGLTKENTRKILRAFYDVCQESLLNGDKVLIQNFGSFVVDERKERTGTDPNTHSKITIPAKKIVKFKQGKEFDEKLNGSE